MELALVELRPFELSYGLKDHRFRSPIPCLPHMIFEYVIGLTHFEHLRGAYYGLHAFPLRFGPETKRRPCEAEIPTLLLQHTDFHIAKPHYSSMCPTP
jgi:hypothetical protein